MSNKQISESYITKLPKHCTNKYVTYWVHKVNCRKRYMIKEQQNEYKLLRINYLFKVELDFVYRKKVWWYIVTFAYWFFNVSILPTTDSSFAHSNVHLMIKICDLIQMLINFWWTETMCFFSCEQKIASLFRRKNKIKKIQAKNRLIQ